MMGSILAVTTQQRDQGVIMDSLLNLSGQCLAAMKKANKMVGIIKKGIVSRTENLTVQL